MKKSKFGFLSTDKKTKIHALKWEPDQGEISGVLQISHGMIEHVERYEAFAKYLTEKGFVVVGNDHLGHGNSVISQDDWGYFAPKNGSDLVVKDLQKLRMHIQKKYPEVPYFILGHSMGSFLLRKYLAHYGAGLSGAVIMGTGTQPNIAVQTGKFLCSFLALFHGWHYRSELVDQLIFSSNNSKFQGKDGGSWLTKDIEIAAAYQKDPRCTFKFTLNGFYNLFDTIYEINQKKNIYAIPKELPLLLVSGQDDPVGNYGTGVRKAYETYQEAGIQDISCKLYPSDRHEILNEIDREIVYDDIYRWLQKHL